MTKKIRCTVANVALLKKASAVKSGWLAMDVSGHWFWFSKKPVWNEKLGYWLDKGDSYLANVKFLKLPKRKPNFAPLSLIKCTSNKTILLSISVRYRKMCNVIDCIENVSLKKGKRND